jgi:hypothetical protein
MSQITPREFLETTPLQLLVPRDNIERARAVLDRVQQNFVLKISEERNAESLTVLISITVLQSNFALAYYSIGCEMHKARIFKP